MTNVTDQELENQIYQIRQDFRRLFLIPAIIVGLMVGLMTILIAVPPLVLLFSFNPSFALLMTLVLSGSLGFVAGRRFWASTRI